MKHERDEQCRVDPDTCLCVECGAYHGGFPCPGCGGRGFHNECCYFFAEEGRRIFELADCQRVKDERRTK